jgi:esterase FrsA
MAIVEKKSLITPKGKRIYYRGPDAAEGLLPAVIYFALSAEMSLFTDPFNQPVVEWNQSGMRVFSWDLPFHENDLDPHKAMHEWAKEFSTNPAFISNFMDECLENLEFLESQGLIKFSQTGLSGLSRGGFMAAHLVSRKPQICYLLGFAPLTKPQPLEEFIAYPSLHYEKIALNTIANKLTHARIKFYIGNCDTRVSTDACYNFIKELTSQAIAQGIRSPQAELVIYPSIGYRGHGTPPKIFFDGAAWLKDQLIQ